ncbi:GNAT family N-acetyltransferase [Desertihabitans brevis]|nr:GNAT family N-acetyltransferase [Desertihabitans brevis]
MLSSSWEHAFRTTDVGPDDDEGVDIVGHALDEVTPLRWRPVEGDDLAAVDELFTAIERHDDPAERHSLVELRENMDHAAHGAEADTVIGTDRGTVVALGWNLVSTDEERRQVFLSGGVHPSWRQLGIGRHLLCWQLAQARQRLRLDGDRAVVVAHCDEKATTRRDLFQRVGLRPVRRHVDLYRPLSDDVPEPQLPPGVELEPLHPERSEDVRVAHNDAFSDISRARPVSAEEWAASMTRAALRPEWSWTAVDTATGEVVGYAISSANIEEWEAQGFSQGWTGRLGVRPRYRGRGIARALLLQSMRSFAAAGLQAAGLGVDTDRIEGPLCLYHQLGYTVADSVIRHEAGPAA